MGAQTTNGGTELDRAVYLIFKSARGFRSNQKSLLLYAQIDQTGVGLIKVIGTWSCGVQSGPVAAKEGNTMKHILIAP